MLTKGGAWRLGRKRREIGQKRKNESLRANDAKLRHRRTGSRHSNEDVDARHRAGHDSGEIVRELSVRPRESGDPAQKIANFEVVALDSRLRGNERKLLQALSPSWPGLSRPFTSLIFAKPLRRGCPRHSAGMTGGLHCTSKLRSSPRRRGSSFLALGPRFRGDERCEVGNHRDGSPLQPAPAKAGAGTNGLKQLAQTLHSSWPGIAVRRTACFRTPMSRPSTSLIFAKPLSRGCPAQGRD
jgi:hypothetical protein